MSAIKHTREAVVIKATKEKEIATLKAFATAAAVDVERLRAMLASEREARTSANDEVARLSHLQNTDGDRTPITDITVADTANLLRANTVLEVELQRISTERIELANTTLLSLRLLKASWLDLGLRDMKFAELTDAPVQSILGIGKKTEQVLATLGVKTIRDLAEWWLFALCHKLVEAEADADVQEALVRRAVVELGLQKESSIEELLDIKVITVATIDEVDQQGMQALKLHCLRDVGEWKYTAKATAILELAARNEDWMHEITGRGMS